MTAAETWILRILVLAFGAVFVAQVASRVRLFLRARNNITVPESDAGARLLRFVIDVIVQSRTIAGRPLVGLAHLAVFWGFTAFAGYTVVEFAHGLGVADLTDASWFRVYRWVLVPFAVFVIGGITVLLIRRVVFRPAPLGASVSWESVLIGGFIITLMVTFLIDVAAKPGPLVTAAWWIHAVIILAFLALIPNSKHFHLLLAPVTVYLRSSVLGTVPNLDFEQEQVGLEAVKDVERKQVLDAFTCVECGRCLANCPAQATGKRLDPKALILQTEAALLAGRLDDKLATVFDDGVLWQCTTCGACERQCPVGVEHLPLIIGARRGLVSNGEAPDALGAVYNHLERRGNIWGLGADGRQKFVTSAGLETFDADRHEYLIWLGCAGAFEADYQRSLRALFSLLRTAGVTFGVLAKERCTGDVAKRTGNEYLFQELAQSNIDAFREARVTRILTGCPHCLRTIGEDYRAFGCSVEVQHSAVFVQRLLGDRDLPLTETVTFHDPCYLGRYAGHTDEPRDLLRRAGAIVEEPVRHGTNPFCCGAGGGLLFEEHEQGKRISQERLDQLSATGAATVITACPFCTVMLKGAAASSATAPEVIDLVTYVEGRLASPRP